MSSGHPRAQAQPTATLTPDTSFDGTPGTDEGTLTLDAATVASGGIDVEGSYTVDLTGGAVWDTGGIGIGLPVSSAVAGGGTLSLVGGGGTLAVDGAIALGEDPGSFPTTAAGQGDLSAADGIAITATGLSLENGAAVSLDATSSLVLGDASATEGALTVGTNATLFATVGGIEGNVVDAGNILLDITDAGGNGTLSVGGDFTLVDTLEVDALTALTVAGTMLLQGGAQFSAEASRNSSATLAVEGAGWTTMTLEDSADWTTGALTVGGNDVPGSATAQGSLEVAGIGGGVITVSGGIVLGQDPGPAAADAGTPGVGTLALSESLITATSLSLLNGSAVEIGNSSLLLGSGGEPTGTLTIGAGGTLYADIGSVQGNVADGGTLTIGALPLAGGGSDAGTLSITGNLAISAGTISAGGTLIVDGAVTVATGQTADIGGTLIAGMLAGSGVLVIGGGTIDAVTGTPTIETYGAPLQLGGSDFTGLTVADIVSGTIDLPDVAPSAAFGDYATTLHIDGGVFSAGSYGEPTGEPGLFTAPDGSGGMLIETYVPCYAAGTRIRGEHGEVPVEALRAGDRVRTLSGRLAPVAWVGWTRVDLARHPHPARAAPIRVAAGAIAPGVPCRDTLLSHDHALYLDGALVPVWQLANGASIARRDGLAAVTYVHVELDRHDILLAEDMPAESYLDTGNRGLFANAAGVRPLHPEFTAAPDAAALRIWATRAAAPLLLGGDAVAGLRDRLRARAAALGWRRTRDAGLAVSADGAALAVAHVGADLWRVMLPAGARTVRLASASFVPAETEAGSGDTRRLGVAVAALTLDGRAVPRRGHGWHGRERGFRWTDGDAHLRIRPPRRGATLEIRLAFPSLYWRAPARAAIRAA